MTAPHSVARTGVATTGAALGIASVLVARRHPDVSLAGSAPWASVAQLLAGWGLVAAGLAHWARRPASRSGPLLAAAGLAWFLVEANDPEVGSSLIFTAGLVLFAACPALLAHAALAYSHGRPRSRVEVVAVALGYAAGVGVLGLLAAALYDPGPGDAWTAQRTWCTSAGAPARITPANAPGCGSFWAGRSSRPRCSRGRSRARARHAAG